MSKQTYMDIAEELSDPKTTLADLDVEAVAKAQAWAKRNKKKWPPKPITTGWQVNITHG